MASWAAFGKKAGMMPCEVESIPRAHDGKAGDMDANDKFEVLIDLLGAEVLIMDIIAAMSEDDQNDYFDYIARMRDIDWNGEF